ncbi:fimbrial protein [Siccibacter colletis]|uniref:fimbrial protein n=1 Tax=Siccibacter colletis TaxID=1505757 RepID=UPI003CFA7F2D
MNGQLHRKLALALMLLTTGALPHSDAADGWDTDGEHGELHLHGALMEAPCRLDMTSAYQEVNMDFTAMSEHLMPGDTGEPAMFSLRLLDCKRTGGNQNAAKTGSAAWDDTQPVVTVSFLAPADPDNPSLLLMKGITGVGLMIRDARGRLVAPGERGTPQFLSPDSDALIFTVTPVRTSARLTTGTFRAVADFWMSYD